MTMPMPKTTIPTPRVYVRETDQDLPPLPEGPGMPIPNSRIPQPARIKEHKERQPWELPEIEDAVDFLAKPMTPQKVLIEGLLHKGSKMSLGSGSKSFKTWTVMDCGMSIAAGLPWLGMNTKKGKVLFVNFELKPESIHSRMEAIKAAKNMSWEKGSFLIWNLRGRAASFDQILPDIQERIIHSNFDVVILDPIYKLYGDVDENSAGDVARMMNALEELAVKTGAAVLFSAHFSKGNQAGKESMDRVSGSGVFGRDPDSILTLTRHEEEDCFTVQSDLRDFKQLEPFVVKWQYPVMVREETLNPDNMKTAISKKAIYSVDDLVKEIVTEPITTRKLKETVMDVKGISQSRFYELLAELKKTGGVTYDEMKKTWSYANPIQAN